ncbi:MAG: lytic transglycosylase domain-containing protein [Xanthomonadales bacterium]|nr:lytic transglycosylase domain-containing protein [Gammaproteobacteria bacterium]MBT8054117.1 lytic transglycosylase domain-containing protein [Gammaproteobacteria bacterium]NND56132.1 lytic transglycosylase domain-containing protein [Xanthomonadales bacterium]NNK51641.1 lytic transglycosylase domain-containing protein [Xanthomonadales bacterium]
MQGIAVRKYRAAAMLAAACLMSVPLAGVAQVYKWVDENGIVTYSNIAPPTDQDFSVLRFPCYAADPKCRSVSWEKVPLNTRAFRTEIRSASQYNAVEESLIRAIIHAESAYQTDAQSPKGAQGLMQLMPQTQQELNVSNPFDPEDNISGGARYLSQLLTQFGGDFELAAAAYNAGPAAVQKYGGVPPYDETQEYVRRVKILYRRYGQAL